MHNILAQMGYSQHGALPATVFFKPNDTFLYLMSTMVSPIIEVGCGTGYNCMKMQEYGEEFGFGHMENCRGFDKLPRTWYDDPMVTVGYDVNDKFPFFHERFTVLCCRPDHGGWFSLMLERMLNGDTPSKRVIWVGKPENVIKDLTQSQQDCVSAIYQNVGEDNELMYVWEMS